MLGCTVTSGTTLQSEITFVHYFFNRLQSSYQSYDFDMLSSFNFSNITKMIYN